MRENNNQSKNSAVQPARLQLVESNPKSGGFARLRRHIVGINPYVKASVCKIFLDSDFDITNLLQVARIAGIPGSNKGDRERKVREILCEAFHEAQRPDPQPQIKPAVTPWRFRVAA